MHNAFDVSFMSSGKFRLVLMSFAYIVKYEI